jgi:hypothetical protein
LDPRGDAESADGVLSVVGVQRPCFRSESARLPLRRDLAVVEEEGEWMSDSGWDEAAVQALVAREGLVRDACAWVESAIGEVSGLGPPGWTGAASVAFVLRLDVVEQELRRAETSLDAAWQAIGATRAAAATSGVG